MSREILFKAKRIDNGEWVEGYYFLIDEKAYIICDAETDCSDGENTDLYATEWYEVVLDTICQYTGFADKNGKKIWENDIVKQFADCNELGNSLYFFYKIRWNNEYCAFEGVEIYSKETFLFPDLEDVEVIGNIFDNPELLNQ